MHFYWRIIEELKFLGETWVITEPSLKRNFERWLRENSKTIALSTISEPIDSLGGFSLRKNHYDLN